MQILGRTPCNFVHGSFWDSFLKDLVFPHGSLFSCVIQILKHQTTNAIIIMDFCEILLIK